MRMTWDNVLIKPLEKKSKVIIPDKQGRIPNKGEVLEVGPGEWYGYPEYVPCHVRAGEKVYFSKDRALEIELKGEKLYVVRERDILGVLTNEEAKD